MTLLLILSGLILLGIGGEALVRGGIALGRKLGMSPHVVGLVIVGFGTSMPELAVSIDAVSNGRSGIAIGNIVGSNIANLLLILPIAALIAPIVRPERLFFPDGAVLLLACAALPLIGLQMAIIPRWQGGAMLGILFVLGIGEYIRTVKDSQQEELFEEEPAIALPEEVPTRPMVALLLTLAGLAAVIYGADLLVEGASRAARMMGVSEAFIGLSIVAIGTSLPELAGSGVAAWRGHSDVAYGNVIGSSIFNILCVFGAVILVGPVTIPREIITADALVMIGAVVVTLFFVYTDRGLSRIEAALMLCLYVAYIAWRYSSGVI